MAPGRGRLRSRRGRVALSIPNLITLARILLVPVVVWAIAIGAMHLAFILFLVAAISDGVDGFLAKRFGMKTELGAYLDPLADKVMIVSIYVTLASTGVIPLWIVILVVSRDIMIVGAIGRALVMRPRLLLLDEPTEGIQPSIIKDIGRAITYLRGLGKMAIVLVEQYLDFASELGDRFVVMDRGSIIYSADRAALDESALKKAMAI